MRQSVVGLTVVFLQLKLQYTPCHKDKAYSVIVLHWNNGYIMKWEWNWSKGLTQGILWREEIMLQQDDELTTKLDGGECVYEREIRGAKHNNKTQLLQQLKTILLSMACVWRPVLDPLNSSSFSCHVFLSLCLCFFSMIFRGMENWMPFCSSSLFSLCSATERNYTDWPHLFSGRRKGSNFFPTQDIEHILIIQSIA